MPGKKGIHGIVTAVCALVLAAPGAAQDGSGETLSVIRDPELGAPVTPFVIDIDLRDLPQADEWRPGDPVREVPRRFYPPPDKAGQFVDPVSPPTDLLYEAQLAAPVASVRAFTGPSRNFPGQGFTGATPPDTAGDVGPSHYIQMVNSGGGSQVRIYDKAEPVPGTITTFDLDALGSGNCASGFGDPIVLYDRVADRWLMSEFSNSGNRLCVYISQTSNPVSGGWYAYNYTAPAFPDYPKYGVWPTDANGGAGSYVVTANDGGPGVYALNRGAMLAGSPGSYQRLTVPDLPGFGFEAPTPADLDGTTPPDPGEPAIVLRHRDTESHSGPSAPADLLELWAFDIDWNNPGNTTLSQLPSIDVAEFDSSTCGLTSFFCFPQPGTGTTLDPLREVVMHRLQYINHGDSESLVGNFVVDVDGSNHGGIRWFELRRSGGGGWTLAQEGTYAPDADHRWMGASAMDQSGNIALAYSVSSSSTFPSLRYTGRLSTDTPNLLTQPESNIHSGTASHSSNRWGDYASMNLDPVDDCTFWFTSLDTTSSSWRTQIASFRFDACGCVSVPGPPSANAAVAGDNRIDVSWDDSAVAAVTEYRVRRSTTPGGPYGPIATIPDGSPGFPGGAGYVYQDTDVSGGTTYYYIIVATDGAACTSDPSNEVGATATGLCSLPPTFDGLQSATSPFTASCAIDLAWNPGTSNCGGSVSYNVYRSETLGFTPGPATLLASGVGGTSYADVSGLASDTPYYYLVRAFDAAAAAEDGNTVKLAGTPQGPLTSGTWEDDAGDTGVARLIPDGPWQIDPSQGFNGSRAYKTGSYNSNTCADLVSPQIQLGTGSVLSFLSRYEIENSWDKGEVQISTNGGSSWQRVPVNYPGTSTNAADNCGLPTGTYFTGAGFAYTGYTADLSAWSNQTAQLRFLLSTDASVVDNGWWIDDIEITNVDVPGECTTGSVCVDNPSVNVMPDGPIETCEGAEKELTADLTGGSGPFTYQWTRDGIEMAGQTSSTLEVSETGTHTYNVKVRADGCDEDVADGFDTSIAWTAVPEFGGLVSATGQPGATCAVDLVWNAATTVCTGPVIYSIYRDTDSPVASIPANRIASGISGTTYADSDGLVSGQTYHYLARAVDLSTGQEESNTVEESAEPTGLGGGPQVLLSEDFTDPVGWPVSTGPGPHSCGDWALSNSATQRPTGGDLLYALSDSDACGSGSETSTWVESPSVSGDLPGIQSVTLEYDIFYRHYDGDDATVEAWDGSAWQVVWADTDDNLDVTETLDVTAQAAGNPDFRVRFNYQNAAWDWWFAVDDVQLTAVVDNACSTVSPSDPPPAPDGSLASDPLTGERITTAGDVIRVRWDTASCLATDYNLIYGDLALVSTYAIDGSQCAVGTAGDFTWNGVPAGDLYFLIVGTDGASTESSWGENSVSAERNGPAASGTCSVATKSVSGGCP